MGEVLAEKWEELGKDAVGVTLDVDAEVCRLGYGTLSALCLLRDTAARLGSMLCHQPGLRLGILVADQRTLIFSPVPLLLESSPGRPDRPNGVALDSLPPAVACDMGLGENPARDRRIGLDPVQSRGVEEVAADLAKAPPVHFDLARRVRVYTARIQFVELSMTGCCISRRKVKIPTELVGLARHGEVERKLHAHFDLVGGKDFAAERAEGRPITEASLNQSRRAIEQTFLVSLSGYGMAVLRANKPRLETAIEELRAEVEIFASAVTKRLQGTIDESRLGLAKALLPFVVRNPPDRYMKFLGPSPSEGQLRELLGRDLCEAFGTAASLKEDMEVKVVYKDVTYESLSDPQFVRKACDAFAGIESMHEEFEALRAGEDEASEF